MELSVLFLHIRFYGSAKETISYENWLFYVIYEAIAL